METEGEESGPGVQYQELIEPFWGLREQYRGETELYQGLRELSLDLRESCWRLREPNQGLRETYQRVWEPCWGHRKSYWDLSEPYQRLKYPGSPLRKSTSRHEASYGQRYPCPALYSFWVKVGLKQSSGPNRGRSPVEWGDFPFVHLSVCLSPPPGPESVPGRPKPGTWMP